MKRRVFMLALLLVLGAIVNVAVAWAYLFLEGPRATDSPHRPIGVTRDFDGVLMVGVPIRSFHWPKYYAHLPDSVIWPGFAINTVFYAAVLWGLFAAPFALRKRRRIKRGLCPKCAYPVGTNAVCTECGARLPSPSC